MNATANRWIGRMSTRTAKTIRVGSLLGVCALSAGLFLFFSAQYYKIGFPLDDAWIHQTYARNLVELRQWVYIPGQVSAGSTSPLWTGLLSIGYLFSQQVTYFWTYLLGILSLFGTALSGELAFRNLTGNQERRFPWAGVFLATEWHLVWGAVSGMETILFAFLILGVFVCLIIKTPKYGLAGALIGASCWVRPDGITLLGPAFFILLLAAGDWRNKIKAGITLLVAFGVFFGAYLAFNYSLSGAVWPNTFYAKQAEYGSMLSIPFWKRWWSLAILPAVGPGAILIIGFLIAVARAIKARNWQILALALWWLGYTTIYAMRLPVTYQHGRYLIPAMPAIFILGLAGMDKYINIPYIKDRLGWMLGKLILVSMVVVQLVFGFKGAAAYAEDVAIIESEMVATAHWLKSNTDPQAIIAVHDIGAIGYLSNRKILDLAGLVSPEVIPFIRDEERLAIYLDDQGANYLVTFPSWYPNLVERSTIVFQTDGKYSIQAGGENMTVFRWR